MNRGKALDHLQTRLETLLGELVERGFELGVQVAVYCHGELAVDVSCGRVSSQSDRPVMGDTIFPVCSTSKGVTATLLHILAARGELDYDSRITRYWPEYGVHGKDRTTVRQALSHQAGIPQRAEYESFAEICDWDTACAKMADLTPIWEPGTRAEYHSFNWGWIAGRIAEGAAGRPFPELLRELITEPLGLTRTLRIGTDDEAESRVSPFEAQPSAQEQVTTAANSHGMGKGDEVPGPLMDFVNREDVRRACMPAVNGMMSAKAIAKLYAAVIGEVDGVRLLPGAVLDAGTTLQTPPGSLPECFGHGMGLGYVLKGTADDPGSFFGHGGAGGSEGMASRRLNFTVGLTKNRMDTHRDAPGHTNRLVLSAVMEVLGHDGDGGFYSGV